MSSSASAVAELVNSNNVYYNIIGLHDGNSFDKAYPLDLLSYFDDESIFLSQYKWYKGIPMVQIV